jgi:hypothetical protein
MKINFVVEDMFVFKYIGCATVARTIYRGLKKQNGIDLTWERYKFHADISHYHTFGPIALLNRRLASGKKILTAHSTPRVISGNWPLPGRLIKDTLTFTENLIISSPSPRPVKRRCRRWSPMFLSREYQTE